MYAYEHAVGTFRYFLNDYVGMCLRSHVLLPLIITSILTNRNFKDMIARNMKQTFNELTLLRAENVYRPTVWEWQMDRFATFILIIN